MFIVGSCSYFLTAAPWYCSHDDLATLLNKIEQDLSSMICSGPSKQCRENLRATVRDTIGSATTGASTADATTQDATTAYTSN